MLLVIMWTFSIGQVQMYTSVRTFTCILHTYSWGELKPEELRPFESPKHLHIGLIYEREREAFVKLLN